jgi:hypothetical protein
LIPAILIPIFYQPPHPEQMWLEHASTSQILIVPWSTILCQISISISISICQRESESETWIDTRLAKTIEFIVWRSFATPDVSALSINDWDETTKYLDIY